MSVRAFFDTNVLVYTDDADAPEKQAAALDLWQRQRSSDQAVISVQVMQEYYGSTTRKLGVDPVVATEKLMLFARADVLRPSADDVIEAARLATEQVLSFWDAMIVRMAVRGGCSVLFSEDMQHGRRFSGLEIRNPFAEINLTS